MNCALRDGTTPLYYACDKGDTAIVKALLSVPSELNVNLAKAVRSLYCLVKSMQTSCEGS